MKYIGFGYAGDAGASPKCVRGNTIVETVGQMALQKITPIGFEDDIGDIAIIYNIETEELAAYLTDDGWKIIEGE